MALSYALYPNKVSKGTGVYRALIKNKNTISLEDIIDRMASRHAGVSKGEALSTIELFIQEVENILSDGGVISTPLFYAECSISGNFNGSDDRFFPNRHEVNINLRPGSRLKALPENIKTHKVESLLPCPFIKTLTDMSSGKENSVIKPGAPVLIKGMRLQFDPEDASQGVFFRGSSYRIRRVEEVLQNTFSQLLIVVPKDLPAETCQLEVRSKLKTQTLRTGTFSKSLTVL
jgi:hypothetical protein